MLRRFTKHRAAAGLLTAVAALTATSGAAFGQADNCADATLITAGVYNGSTAAATNDGASLCGNTSSSRDVWFRFVASEAGEVTFETCGGSNYDTVLSLHTGCPGSGGNTVQCNDDSCGLQSRVSAVLQPGQQVLVRVGGYNQSSGSFTLTVGVDEPPPPPSAGPDVIVGDLPSTNYYGTAGGISAFAVGTTSCNVGDFPLDWIAGNNRHPVIGQNMYRIKDGRFEQIGQSWLKHGFTALQGTVCGSCNSHPNGTALGVGCSDPYSAGLNASQGGLGPRFEVNATTGQFPYPFTSPSYSGAIARRLQVKHEDLTPAQNVGAIYLVEGHYVALDDATWDNALNNASYRRVNIASATSNPSNAGPTVRAKTAIEGWADIDNTVELTMIDYNEGDRPARFILGNKVIDNGNGTWTYVYAIHNLNAHRSASGLFVPADSVSISDIGFTDVDYHSGEPYDNTDWTQSSSTAGVEWNSPQTYAQNQNTNALRWGTTYTYWFTANSAPTTGDVTLTFFRPGTDATISAATRVPTGAGCPGDWDQSGGVDGDDITAFFADWQAGNADIDQSGGTDGDDITFFFVRWQAGC